MRVERLRNGKAVSREQSIPHSTKVRRAMRYFYHRYSEYINCSLKSNVSNRIVHVIVRDIYKYSV